MDAQAHAAGRGHCRLDLGQFQCGAAIAAIERAKSLGETENSLARLNSDVKRLMTEINREIGTLGLWTGSIEKLELLKTFATAIGLIENGKIVHRACCNDAAQVAHLMDRMFDRRASSVA